MNTFQRIQAALASLRGLPMSAAGWAGDIAWFAFGAPVTRLDRGGRLRTVGEYSLHLSCPWRWLTSSGFQRADDTSPPSALHDLTKTAPRYEGVELTDSEHLTFRFDNGDVLIVEGVPDSRAHEPESGARDDEGDDDEYWRLLQAGLGTPHLVVSSSGVEWHEA